MNRYLVSPQAHQHGIALTMALIFMMALTLIAVSGKNAALVQERISGNSKQMAGAFMAAESGIAAAVDAFYADDFVFNNQLFNEQATINKIKAHHNPTGLAWKIESIQPHPAPANVERLTLRSRSQRPNPSVSRTVELDIWIPANSASPPVMNWREVSP